MNRKKKSKSKTINEDIWMNEIDEAQGTLKKEKVWSANEP